MNKEILLYRCVQREILSTYLQPRFSSLFHAPLSLTVSSLPDQLLSPSRFSLPHAPLSLMASGLPDQPATAHGSVSLTLLSPSCSSLPHGNFKVYFIDWITHYRRHNGNFFQSLCFLYQRNLLSMYIFLLEHKERRTGPNST